MTMSSNGPMGCSKMAKASKIERSPESGCTQALAFEKSIKNKLNKWTNIGDIC